MESIAYQTNDILKAMETDTGIDFQFLCADGGASANKLLMQFQADISGLPVICPQTAEATALGAAFLAGLAVGFWKDTQQLTAMKETSAVYQPAMDDTTRQTYLSGWADAVARCKGESV